MRKEARIGILLIVIVFISIISAYIAAAGCVTYEQARAQGIQGTDAELRSKGFCPGTSTTSAAAPTTGGSQTDEQTQQAATSTQAASSSARQTSGLNMEQLRETEQASSDEFYQEQSRIYDSGGDDFDYNAATAIYEKYRKAISDSYASYNDKFMRILDERGTCYRNCKTKAGLDRADSEGDYDLWRDCRGECENIADIAQVNAYKIHVDAVIQNNRNNLEELTALEGTPHKQESLPPGPKFDTDSNKGLDVAGKIAASMGGYLGSAYVVRPDGTKVIPGKELYLSVDDKLVTGTESKANIIFGNIGKMKLGPDSELRVGRAQLDQYYLMKGTLKTDIMLKEGEKFEIHTPNAKVKMKGTDFVTEYNETTNITTVYLNEGNLEIESDKATLNLTAGNYCTILADGTITSSQMEQKEWDSLGSSFLDESALEETIVKIYLWITLAVIIIASVLSRVFVKRASKHVRKGGKDLGIRSVILGVLGLITVLFPIIGYSLSAAAVTCARIQKLRKPTLTAKIGLAIGIAGVILNGVIFLFALIGVNLG